MADLVTIELDFRQPTDDPEVLERQTQTLWRELQAVDAIESVGRVADPNPPEGNFSGGGLVPGLVKLALTPVNLGAAVGWLKQKLGKQPIKVKVKSARGDEYEIDVRNPDDFERVAAIAQKLALGEPVDHD